MIQRMAGNMVILYTLNGFTDDTFGKPRETEEE